MISPYLLFNLSLAGLLVPLALLVTNRRHRAHDLLLAARIALFGTLVAYPWDFFGIATRVWIYPNDPGPRLYTVPFNDLAFIFLGCYFASALLIPAHRRARAGNREAEGEHTGDQNTR